MKSAHGISDFSRSRGERGKDHEKSKKTCKWKVDEKRVVLVLLKKILADNITLKDEQMNQAEAYQLLPDLKKRKVFIQSNPYYSYYRESSNKRPKISLYFCIFTKARKSSWSRLASLAFLLRWFLGPVYMEVGDPS